MKIDQRQVRVQLAKPLVDRPAGYLRKPKVDAGARENTMVKTFIRSSGVRAQRSLRDPIRWGASWLFGAVAGDGVELGFNDAVAVAGG